MIQINKFPYSSMLFHLSLDKVGVKVIVILITYREISSKLVIILGPCFFNPAELSVREIKPCHVKYNSVMF